MAVKKEYLEFLLEWLAPLGEITDRRMMGGCVLYCDGIVFALVTGGSILHLKGDDVTRPRFEALGLRAFQPFADKPGTMQFYPPPAEFFEDPEVMEDWGRAAIEVGRRAQARKKLPKSKPKKQASRSVRRT